jgi:23S rRNA (cytidine1920-2'-O)/16S rRNA (cytidine1409-2'-O)-methyltransferase
VNARYLEPKAYGKLVDLAVMDVSFISVRKILPAVIGQLTAEGRIITLIKPQFEVGRAEVGPGGIVTDPEKHSRVVQDVNNFAAQSGLCVSGTIESPIKGADGNIEFLAFYERNQNDRPE